jgi:flavorubredoxin
MNFDFGEAIKNVVEAVKNLLQEMAKAFSDLVETLSKDSVYYQYVHSSVREGRHKATAVINQGGVTPATTHQVVNQVSRAQPKELSSPTFNHQS